MSHSRMFDKDHQPSEAEMAATMGEAAPRWKALQDYLAAYYATVAPETVFGGKNYGWSIRYRKSGKTLCTLFPEENAFCVLIVLGKKEVDKVQAEVATLSPHVRDVFENTSQLHDGRWLWIHPADGTDVEAIKTLLHAKRKPQKQAS